MKKLFTNDKFFLVVTVLSAFGQLIFATDLLIFNPSDYYMSVILVVFALCEVALYASFIRHEKNLMKNLMGALLMGNFVFAVSNRSVFDNAFDSICGMIHIILVACVVLNHFIVSSNRKSLKANNKFNQLLVFLSTINVVVWHGSWCIGDCSVATVILTIVDIVSFVGLMASVVCVDSLIDTYKQDREAAGWTEEAGYPEGYVHEYEKKGNK